MMKVRLLRDARIKHHKGEIVEISDPLELRYLVSVGSAEPLDEVKVETPEEVKAEAVETPEKKKPTRKTKK